MPNRIIVEPLNRKELLLDSLMVPLMYLISGTIREEPQKTHRWNNTRLSDEALEYLNPDRMVHSDGAPEAIKPGKVNFHIPIINGWKKYVVVLPYDNKESHWHVGWIAPGHSQAVSRIPLTTAARVLIGPGPCKWFAVSPSGLQLNLRQIAEGQIGDCGDYRNLPLL